MFSRLESPHLPFSLSHPLMRVLRSIIQPFVLPMFDARHQFLFGVSVASQFIGGDQSRCGALALKQFLEEALRRFGITT